MTNKISKVIV